MISFSVYFCLCCIKTGALIVAYPVTSNSSSNSQSTQYTLKFVQFVFLQRSHAVYSWTRFVPIVDNMSHTFLCLNSFFTQYETYILILKSFFVKYSGSNFYNILTNWLQALYFGTVQYIYQR